MSWLLNLANNPAQTLFLLLLFFFPSQLGRHFWPEFSFINGLRVDYLSPIVYFTDILIGLLFLEFLPSLIRQITIKRLGLVLLIFGSMSAIALTSLSLQNSLLGVLRLAELFFVAYCVRYFFSKQSFFRLGGLALSLALLYTALLAAGQFFLQHSLGGVWYWLGERTFSGLTPGIANVSLNGNLLLRPYATFAHPNVLAGFAVITLTFLLFFIKKTVVPAHIFLLSRIAVLFGITATILSLSRTGIAALVFVLIVWFVSIRTSVLNRLLVVCLVILGVAILQQTGLLIRFTQLNLDQSILIREFLMNQAIHLFQAQPLTGVGLQNFLPALAVQLPPFTPLAYFQPVHSFYLLLLAETGVLGAGLAFLFILLTIIHLFKKTTTHKLGKLLLLCVFLFLGVTDHYLYTLHQGQLLTAFVFGIVWLSHRNSSLFTVQKPKNLRTKSRSRHTAKSLTAQPMKNSRKGGSTRKKIASKAAIDSH